ncbi:winged helix-turn-helix domain-containing protein [Amycolatopsis keratiniphila]|uniref:ArsR family transcriptional regulator n=2 Tax=Amycolatopsis keratiniphila TaxID=129921 RepID=A0A1W2LY48_9PSEU|nr:MULTISPECIES: winged helix-turn-helix domain-containing protein [Amycolatopsis]AGM04944.1 putative transcriptional regulator [Amycolatopsis keratiniphila]OLZ48595.1 ArsR family transcriptional regulator [Amycolatopsis keratiniphila subsp. nogabecina]ONF71552.1 ArsR family transcriptional regulator [Amycolatopsis keratiniphila subsp. keratiniphila]RSN33863.1 ArsR family transcriptional regulator [Amycolatopsis sp. WAC 04169]SDU36381.1 Helix-turn-helix domain-containing protein [Amycolatopsis
MPTPRRAATEAEIAAMASGIRLRIIRLTYSEALTNKELAERLDRDPATTLHHVRKLVDTGFLEALPPRRGTRGAKEIPYRSTGLSWHLDSRDRGIDQAIFEAYLAEIADVGFDEVQQTRLVVQVPDEQITEFETRLMELVDDFMARPVDPEAKRTAIYLSKYPSR